MRIGLPREIKDGEFRCALTPAGARALVGAGHQLHVEAGAGAACGFADADYAAAGARLASGPDAAWDCTLVLKVKELQSAEYARPRPGQSVFCFQHFGPEPPLLDAALTSGATFVAFETVGEASGLPILSPMSAIAGRLAIQFGAACLQNQNGGSGVLLPGLEGIAPGRVAILGAGNVGSNALAVAHALGAQVSLFAASDRRRAALCARYPQRLEFHVGTAALADTLREADLVIGGVLVPGSLSPKLVSRAMLAAMRRGSALVDVGIDQGGVAETSRPTTHSRPFYVEEGVVHCCVPNLPSACARTASIALERALLPYAQAIAAAGTASAARSDPALASGIQAMRGRLTHAKLARDTGRAHTPLIEALEDAHAGMAGDARLALRA